MKKIYLLFVALLLTGSLAYAQEFIINGTVTDSDDRAPVQGAAVYVDGTNRTAITGSDGTFRIEASKGEIIVVTFVGMASQSIVVEDGRSLNIILQEAPTVIENVVVTAFGIPRDEKALGYSVQKVSGTDVQKVPGVDVATSLTGKVSGLLVRNSTDFAAEPTVSIRGESPILVIDGVPFANMSLRDVSADDVESISVLKGATASALYGYRGASGAIMVTTKNGSGEEGGITVSLWSNTMFSAGFLAIPEKQAVYGRGTANIYNKDQDQSWGIKMDGSMQLQWDPFLKQDRTYAYLPVGENNFRNFLEQGHITNNTVSVAYSGQTYSIRNSLNWTQTKGQYPNSRFDKYSYTLGADVNMNRFKITSNMAYHKQTSPNLGFNGYTSYDPMYSLLVWTASDYNVLDYKDYWIVPDITQNFTYKATHNNPYFDRNEKVKELNRDIFNASLGVSYEITDWLQATVRSGIDFYIHREDIRVSKDSYVTTGNTAAGNGTTWIGQWTGAYATGRNSGYSLNNDLLLTADKTFGDFKLNVLAGGTIYFRDDNAIWANTNGGISVPGFFSLAASVNPATVGSSKSRQQVNSIFGRVEVSWRNMIFAEATGRNDWSSTLPASTRSYFYPSVSGSFVFSELLPQTRNWLDLAKVRGSWTMSKTPPGIYDTNTNYTVTNSAWGTASAAYLPTTLRMDDVRPEAATTFEIGLQAFFLKNRIMFDLTYYDKRMYDFLVTGAISSASGFSGIYVNSEEIRSRRGWEITVNATPFVNADWKVDVGLNWSKYARYYVAIDETYSTDRLWVRPGGRIDVYEIYRYARDPEGNMIFSNGNIQLDPFLSNYGYYDPDWIWGISTSVTYKDFTLGMSFDGRVGGLANTVTESYMWNSGSHPGTLTRERELDVETPGSANFLGQGVKVISGSVQYDSYGNVLSDTRVFGPNDVYTTYRQYINALHSGTAWGGNGREADCYSTTFLKLRELSLTWNVPSRFVKGWAKSASVAFVGQNVWMWAKDFKYSDPDGGSENFADPSVRYLGFNVKLTF